jgi:hypothetical protein
LYNRQKELKFINKPVNGLGILQNGEEVCFSCFQKINKIDRVFAKNLKFHSREDLVSLLSGSLAGNISAIPQTKGVAYFPKKKMTIGKKVMIGIGGLLFIIIVASLCGNPKKNETKSSDPSNQQTNTYTKIGELLKTQYFEITANKVQVVDRVSTGNEFADLKPEKGNFYLIINATFKNIDNESRMLMDGSVWINYNGKDYEFDKSEPVMAEGWGLFLDQINPLISKTTNLVYKIPAEIKGGIYWQPGRASSSEKIFLGSIK